jgi:hypothetical protein
MSGGIQAKDSGLEYLGFMNTGGVAVEKCAMPFFNKYCSPLETCPDGPEFSVSKDIFLAAWMINEFIGKDVTSSGLPTVPDWFKLLPRNKLMAFMSGVFVGSGGVVAKHCNPALVGVILNNEEFAHDIFDIGLKCGIPFEFSEHDSHVLFVSDYESAKMLEPSVVPELFSTKNESNMVIKDGKAWQLVSSISLVDFNGLVFNFEVDEDHTYCANHVRTHNCFIFHEWDESKKMWSRASMLPPEEVSVFEYPFTTDKRIEYRPETLIKVIANGESYASAGVNSVEAQILEGIPQEIKDMVRREGCIVMDSDPMAGSFCHHVARNRAPYMDLGISVLEGVYVPLLQREHYKYTQLSLATRNMTPKTLVCADGIMPEDLNELRVQIDQSYLDPDYAIVVNFDCTWQQIGTQDRLLDLSK